jgi:transglutaminase-like putative cysteine protease
VEASVFVTPEPDERSTWIDGFGNDAESFAIRRVHDSLEVLSSAEVIVDEPVAAPLAAGYTWETAAERTSRGTLSAELDARRFRVASPFATPSPSLKAYASSVFEPDRDALDSVRALCRTIFDEFDFDASFSDVSTPLAEVLLYRRGVCQDFAHLAVACCRSMGLAARYTSGYIETEPAPGEPKLAGADASHAWAAVWLPEMGWLEFDPTNDQLPPNRHVTLAWGRDYGDVAPLQGVVVGPAAPQDLVVEVDVTSGPV